MTQHPSPESMILMGIAGMLIWERLGRVYGFLLACIAYAVVSSFEFFL